MVQKVVKDMMNTRAFVEEHMKGLKRINNNQAY